MFKLDLKLALSFLLTFSACTSGEYPDNSKNNSDSLVNTDTDRESTASDASNTTANNNETNTKPKTYRHFLIPEDKKPDKEQQETTSVPQFTNNQASIDDSLESDSERCSQFISGTPIGLSCLHCAHPNARGQALQTAKILRNSCRENIALTFLVDGTFGTDRDFMGELVRIATERGAQLHLYLYFGNGPWQRRLGAMPDRGFGSSIRPEDFRREILTNENLRDQFRELVKFNEPLIDYANSRGAIVYIMPMLEDNLDYNSAREMEALIQETILPEISYALGRNPCPNCYSGNDGSIARGTFFDDHIGSANDQFSHTNGLVVNDGKSFNYSFEARDSKNLTFKELLTLIERAKSTNNTFVIWKRQYQGVAHNFVLNDPNNRTYKEISPQEKTALMGILRTP